MQYPIIVILPLGKKLSNEAEELIPVMKNSYSYPPILIFFISSSLYVPII